MKTTMTSMLLTLTIILIGASTAVVRAQTVSNVVVNGTRLSAEIMNEFQQVFGVRIPNGNYWYDGFAGAWGKEGGPTLGFTLAGMNLGGKLRADASNGNTKVFVNGRELHSTDVARLNQLIAPYSCQPGRYLVDSNGNLAYENGQYLGNLIQVAQAKYGPRGGGGKKSGYDSGIGSVISDGSGFIGYAGRDSSTTIR